MDGIRITTIEKFNQFKTFRIGNNLTQFNMVLEYEVLSSTFVISPFVDYYSCVRSYCQNLCLAHT